MHEKIFITGHIIEVYGYEKLNIKNDRNMSEVAKGEGKDREINYLRRQQKRRDNIRRLITMNFDVKLSKFITLTFKDTKDFDIKSVRECNHQFTLFIKRLKNTYPSLEYVSVIEFQDLHDRGAVHYHMICNLPFIKKVELEKIWKNGYLKINAIDKVDNIGAYVVKYMTKENADTRLQGLKAYNCSTGLERPLEVKSWVDGGETIRNLENLYHLTEKKAVYSSEYHSEECGHISYLQYNLSRKDE
jgi:hypothetical protein